MMDNTKVTLKDFFLPPAGLYQTKLSSPELEANLANIKKALDESKVTWPLALNKISEKTEDLLDISVPDILVSAWNKYFVLLKYLDKKKYPPNETFLVPLLEHTVKSQHHPFIELIINNVSITKLDFDINVSLTLKGMVLKIQDGKVLEISTGNCKGKGTVKCHKLLILEKETRTFSMPQSIKLGKGIPIAPG